MGQQVIQHTTHTPGHVGQQVANALDTTFENEMSTFATIKWLHMQNLSDNSGFFFLILVAHATVFAYTNVIYAAAEFLSFMHVRVIHLTHLRS